MSSTAASIAGSVILVGGLLVGCAPRDADPAPSPGTSETACAEPIVEISGDANPGSTIEVTGDGWLKCDDVDPGATPTVPDEVVITWIDTGDSVSADLLPSDGSFTATIAVPESLATADTTLRVAGEGFVVDVEVAVSS